MPSKLYESFEHLEMKKYLVPIMMPGTTVVQGFNSTKIMGDASSYLWQEFGELELLNEVQKMRYEGVLPPSIDGDYKNIIIGQY